MISHIIVLSVESKVSGKICTTQGFTLEVKELINFSYQMLHVVRSFFPSRFTNMNFRSQLVACRERLADLEKKLEDPSDENRVRLLGGEDPEPEVLAKKIEELELRLAEKEEKLLEKDLIYEEVSRLAERTKKKSETGKEDTLELAKRVCWSVCATSCRQGRRVNRKKAFSAMHSQLVALTNSIACCCFHRASYRNLAICILRVHCFVLPDNAIERG